MTIDWPWDAARLGGIHQTLPDPKLDRLINWASWTVQSLDNLPTIDDALADQRGTQIVEQARIRWAAGSAATSIDLCAAYLGVRYCCRKIDGRAAALSDYVETYHSGQFWKGKAAAQRAAVPVAAQEWIDATSSDCDYQTVRRARNPFTHSALARHIRIGETVEREYFAVGTNGSELSSTQIVDVSIEVATKWVGGFLTGLEAKEF